jgi:hypothetical protein
MAKEAGVSAAGFVARVACGRVTRYDPRCPSLRPGRDAGVVGFVEVPAGEVAPQEEENRQ